MFFQRFVDGNEAFNPFLVLLVEELSVAVEHVDAFVGARTGVLVSAVVGSEVPLARVDVQLVWEGNELLYVWKLQSSRVRSNRKTTPILESTDKYEITYEYYGSGLAYIEH